MTWRVRRTTLITIGLLALLVGLFVARFTEPLSVQWVVFGVCLLPLLARHIVVRIAVIVFFCLVVGWWRGGLLQAQNMQYKERYGQKVTLQARALEDGYYTNNSQLGFSVTSVVLADGTRLPGKIRVSGFGVGQVYRHDAIRVTGKLYPSRGGKQATISYAEIDVVARADSWIERVRREFVAGVQTALPEPAASFGVGLLVGERSLLPEDVALALTAAGLTHIVAVSGYNLTIIIRAVTRGLRRLSRFQILLASSSLIYLFLLFTGFSPSIVRASLVSGLGLLAWYFGRTFRPLLLISLVAAITAMANPYYVWGDIGWYLSFLAFAGVLILAPLVTVRFFATKTTPLLGQVAIESFSAQIMTVPIVLFIFGRVSIIGFVANVVIVPLVPIAMLATLVAGLAGMFVPVIAGWLALPARVLLDVMLWLAAWFARLPGATRQASVGVFGMMLLYGSIAAATLGLRRRAQSVTIEQK